MCIYTPPASENILHTDPAQKIKMRGPTMRERERERENESDKERKRERERERESERARERERYVG
jgi:hypothetical protein